MTVISLRLPDELQERLARESQRANAARSEIARRAVAEYLERLERERLLADMVAAARALAADPAARAEALQIAADFLPLENEALDRSEGDASRKQSRRPAAKSRAKRARR
jgi:predicted transcriptional regulator